MPLRCGVWLLGAAVLALSGVALSGCDSHVDVQPPVVQPEVEQMCADLIAALPEQIVGQPSTPTEPLSNQTAAWGSPPIIVTCGVPEPAAFEPTAHVEFVNGVDWFPEEQTDGYVFTSWGRLVRVEVQVPSDYAPEINPLVDLAPAIKATVPKL